MPVCPQCKSTNIGKDPSTGATVCKLCGTVIDDVPIVTDEIQFGEDSSVIGQFISSNTSRYNGERSRDITIEAGKYKIEQVASMMHLRTSIMEAAQRLFALAVQRNFIQGRRSSNVAAACLYIVCRREKTPHLLIDFADAIQANVFTVGQTFMRLCRFLNIQLPLADPSLYIQRFASQLELGVRTLAVAHTALRVVQRMGRDWIHTGRRPSGICGAGLLLACRLHGFRRTPDEIANVVKIGDTTLRKRLFEFEQTAASKLTIDELDDKENEESNPPSFNAGKKKAEKLAQRRALVLSAAQARLADPNVPRCISTPLLEKQTKKRHESGHEHENERQEKRQRIQSDEENEWNENLLEKETRETLEDPHKALTDENTETVDNLITELKREWPLMLNHDEMEKEILSTIISQEFRASLISNNEGVQDSQPPPSQQSENSVESITQSQSQQLSQTATQSGSTLPSSRTSQTQTAEPQLSASTNNSGPIYQPIPAVNKAGLQQLLPDMFLFDDSIKLDHNEPTTEELSKFSSSYLPSVTPSNAVDSVLLSLGTECDATPSAPRREGGDYVYEKKETAEEIPIDDEEIDSYLVSEQETETRAKIWYENNKDWIKTEAKKEEERRKKPVRKPRKKRISALQKEHRTPADAAKAALQTRTSAKINWNALDRLLNPMMKIKTEKSDM